MRFLILTFLFMIVVANTANAQLAGTDFAVGGSCASFSAGDTMMSADADFDLQDVILICDGSVWQTMAVPSPITIERIQDRDDDTVIDVNTSDDDVARFFSSGREVANIYASGANNTFFKLMTNSAGSDTGFVINENSVNTAYMGLGYGSSALNIDAIQASDNIIFRTQGTERMRIVGSTNNIGINQPSPGQRLSVNGNIRMSRILNYSFPTSYADFSADDVLGIYLDGSLKYLETDGTAKTITIGATGDSSTPDEIILGNDYLMFIERDTNNHVGILNDTPDLELDIAGTLKLGQTVATCNGTIEGAIRWSVANDCVEVCDGIAWECSLEDSCTDDLPAAWVFVDEPSAPVDSYVESNIIQITGVDPTCLVQVKPSGNGNPQYRICSDAACSVVDLTWTSLLGTIQNNKYIQIRATSPATGQTTQITSLRVGARSQNWSMTTSGSCADPNPPEGTLCADGTVYIGRTPDGFVKMFSTRCRQPRVFDGVNCVGNPLTLPWNDYSSEYQNAVGANSFFQGQRNTTDLVNADPNTNTNARAPYGHMAAQFCDKLGDLGEPSSYGYTDWYLPSQDEIDDMCNVLNPLGYDWSSTHWSSTETNSDRAHYERGDCYSSHENKRNLNTIRCVRKESTNGTDISPDAFSFTDQTGVATDTVIVSNQINISGTDAASLVTTSGSGNPEVSFNGGTTWASSGTINFNGSIMVRLTSSSSPNTMTSAIVTIGGVNSTWNVTTGP